MSFIEVRRIQVLADRIEFEISLSDACTWHTNAQIAEKILARRPNIARHACINGIDITFGAVIANTPLPHLLEHCAIDYLTEAASDEDFRCVGTSEWLDATCGRALIELSMRDDLETLRAFKRATELLEEVLAQVLEEA